MKYKLVTIKQTKSIFNLVTGIKVEFKLLEHSITTLIISYLTGRVS